MWTGLLAGALLVAAGPPPAYHFRRGDVDGDSTYSIGDPIRLLDFAFAAGPPPPCMDAADFDDDGRITLGDAIALLNFLFAGGPAPAPPGIGCGSDPTPDALRCELAGVCTGGIDLLGRRLEGNAFFFLCDHSSSMNHTHNGKGKLHIMKEIALEAIARLGASMEFGIVLFDASMLIFREEPVRADEATKAGATAFVLGAPPGRGTCIAEASVRILEIARRSRNEKRRIILLSDGMPACFGAIRTAETLRDITAANIGRIPIDTVFIGDDGGWEDPGFMQQLAALNGGTFIEAP